MRSGYRAGLLVGLMALLAACKPGLTTTQAQAPAVPRNEVAERFLAQGEAALQVRNYGDAAIAFDNAALQPFNQVTTAALYLSGLAYSYQAEYDRALEKFQQLISQYPESRFVEEANYEKAGILLRRPGSEPGGLYLLLNLIEQTKNPELKADAEALLRRFYYETADLEFLKTYLQTVRPSYRSYTQEAIAYRLYQRGDRAALSAFVKAIEQSGGSITERMRQLQVPTGIPQGRELLRVVLVLPFGSGRADTAIDRTSRVALQLYEGMRLAIEREQFAGVRRVELKVLDSQDDPARIRQLVTDEILPFRPHVVVGDIRNTASEALAQGLAGSGVLQLVPFSDADQLLQASPALYLANPSVATQAATQARYAVEQLEKKRFAILYENTEVSQGMANAFEAQVKALGGTVIRRLIPLSATDAQGPVQQLSDELELSPVDAVYMPILNQETVSLSLFRFSTDSIGLKQVLGTERWRTFRSMDQELLHQFNVIVTDAYEPGLDAEGYKSFARAYYSAYGLPPTPFALQGYDLIRWLVHSWGTVPTAETLPTALAQAPPYRGLAQTFYLGSARSNQSVQLLRFTPLGIERLSAWQKPLDR